MSAQNVKIAGGGGIKHCSPSNKSLPAECSICFDNFNKSTRAIVHCGKNNCNTVACKSCVRTYLLGTTQEPHCMDCKSAWNQRFIVENLNSSFVSKEYNAHRKNLLVEKELARLPEAMEVASRYREAEQLERTELRKCMDDVKQALALYREARDRERAVLAQIETLRLGKCPGKKEIRKFTFPCPDEECRGLLSTAYKCEICMNYTCPKCFQITGKERHAPEHVCNEDLVKTAELIRESTKGCPKCGERIAKSEGCDQMWCTSCQTTFSWRTGQILENVVIHNPHYYEYKRKVESGEAPRNPGDVLCGGMPHRGWQVRRMIRDNLNKTTNNGDKSDLSWCQCCAIAVENPNLDERHRVKLHKAKCKHLYTKYDNLQGLIAHITNFELQRKRTDIRRLEETLDYRVKYLLGELSKEELGQILISNDKKRRKLIELVNIEELISVVGIETLRDFEEVLLSHPLKSPIEVHEYVTNKFAETEKFFEYVNTQMKIISVSYSQSVKQISLNTFESERKKFKKSDLESFA